MNKLTVAAMVAALSLTSVAAFADNSAGAVANAGSVSGAQAQSGVGVAVNKTANLVGQNANQAITFNSAPAPTSTEMTIRSAPPVVAPALTTTLTETCMGSSSVGASGVGFGVSFGSTWTDHDCQNRLDARQLVAMGYRDAARVVMCSNPVVREAFKATGNPCPGDEATKVSQSDSNKQDQVALVTTDSQGKKWERANEESSWMPIQK
ncbi:MAG: hypothetical protein ACYC1Y_00155 [Minisyncoccota bacterium]